MSKLTDKVAVVTGASKGIGAAIAKSLAAEGASVVVNYSSSKAGADKVVSEITTSGGKAIAVRGDVSKAAEAQGVIDAAIKKFGHLDILVNNSGVYEFLPIEAFTEEHYNKIFKVNVLGLLLTTQAAVKHLGEGASIINIGSVVSSLTPPNSAVYTGTKGAVDAITGVLAKELGPKKIRVNSINPGMVEAALVKPTTLPLSPPSSLPTIPSGSQASLSAPAAASANHFVPTARCDSDAAAGLPRHNTKGEL